jgi:hypothetical protein
VYPKTMVPQSISPCPSAWSLKNCLQLPNVNFRPFV